MTAIANDERFELPEGATIENGTMCFRPTSSAKDDWLVTARLLKRAETVTMKPGRNRRIWRKLMFITSIPHR
jgi:hypothetical protein